MRLRKRRATPSGRIQMIKLGEVYDRKRKELCEPQPKIV
jgi:hypothetical protein